MPVNGHVLNAVSDPVADAGGAGLIQLQDGAVLRYTAGSVRRLAPAMCFSSPCPTICATPAAAYQQGGALLGQQYGT